MTTTLKTTNARIDGAEQRLGALESQVPDALTTALHEQAAEETKQRLGAFKNALGKIVKDLVAKHFPETRKLGVEGMYPTGITIAFPGIYISEYSEFEITAQDGTEYWDEDALRTKLTELLFRKRIQRLVQASEPPEKETSK